MPALLRSPRHLRFAAVLAVLGPGLVSGFADNDAGGITTYSLAGVQFGYDLLWVILASQVVLFFTQEVGARLALATGQGMTGLIRERFGVRWATFAACTMLVANLGTTVAEFAGIGAALDLFGIPVPVSAALAAVAVVLLISAGSFGRVQYAFVLVGVGVSLAYVASAILSHPDWGRAAVSLVIPHGALSNAYWLAVVGTVGTTITPWGQAFIQAYAVDKRLGPDDLTAERLDVGLGTLITNLVAATIVVACAATIWATGRGAGINPNSFTAAEAARALLPSPAGPPRSCSRSGCWQRRCSGSGWCRSRPPTRPARRSAGKPASTGAGGRRRPSMRSSLCSWRFPRCSYWCFHRASSSR
jgi:Mn2+/Fe2+ NRAMP family transporter